MYDKAGRVYGLALDRNQVPKLPSLQQPKAQLAWENSFEAWQLFPHPSPSSSCNVLREASVEHAIAPGTLVPIPHEQGVHAQ